MHIKSLRAVALGGSVSLAAMVLSASAASAQTSTSQLNVTLAIQAECKLTSITNVAFGTTGVIQAAITATGSIGVQCTNTTPYNVGLNAGSGTAATVTARKMTAGAGATVTYSLYRDTARTQVWGDTVGTNTVSGKPPSTCSPQRQVATICRPEQPYSRGGICVAARP